jgi:hypothetical protein
MDSTIARLFYRAARKVLVRDAAPPKPKKSRREETGRGLRKQIRASGGMRIATMMDVSEAFYQSNPYNTLDPCWQSIIHGGGFDEGCSDDYMTQANCPSLNL